MSSFSLTSPFLGPLLFLLYINDIQNCTSVFDIHPFADDSNLFSADKNLRTLETTVNNQISCVFEWLCANKLSLNVEKSNYIIFHPVQKKINHQVNIFLKSQLIKQVLDTSYLGVVIDCHLNWKAHVAMLSKKIKRNVGAISKIRQFVSSDILKNLYYSLVYPFLIYGLVVWGNLVACIITTPDLLQDHHTPFLV